MAPTPLWTWAPLPPWAAAGLLLFGCPGDPSQMGALPVDPWPMHAVLLTDPAVDGAEAFVAPGVQDGLDPGTSMDELWLWGDPEFPRGPHPPVGGNLETPVPIDPVVPEWATEAPFVSQLGGYLEEVKRRHAIAPVVPPEVLCGPGSCLAVVHTASMGPQPAFSRVQRWIHNHGLLVNDPYFVDGPEVSMPDGWGGAIQLFVPRLASVDSEPESVRQWQKHHASVLFRAYAAWMRREAVPPHPAWAARVFAISRERLLAQGRTTPWASPFPEATMADFADVVPSLPSGLDWVERARRFETMGDGIPGTTEHLFPLDHHGFGEFSADDVPVAHREPALRDRVLELVAEATASNGVRLREAPRVLCHLGPCFAIVRLAYEFPVVDRPDRFYAPDIRPRFGRPGRAAVLDPAGGEVLFLWPHESISGDAGDRARAHLVPAWYAFSRAYVAWLRGEEIAQYPRWAAETFAVPMVDQLQAGGEQESSPGVTPGGQGGR